MPILQNLIVEDADLPPILSYTVDGQGQASGSSSTFAPPDIPGNLLWLRSDLGITIATGVSTWADQSGNGNNLTQATGTKQPVYSAIGGPNNLPMLTCTSASAQDMTVAFSIAQPVYVWMIAIWNTAFVNTATLCDGHTSNSLRIFANGTGGQLEMDCGTALASSVGAALIATWYNYAMTANGVSSSLLQNGVSIMSGNAGTATPTGFTIASDAAGGVDNANCSFAEIALYNKLPTAAQIQQLTQYRVARYGF